MDRQETTRLMNEILGTLSEEQRMVITLYYYEEMNAREIGETLGLSENTIRSRLNYGKKKIEAKVLEIEKRDGIRLHSLAPVPFLLLLFRSHKTYASVLPNRAVLQGITEATVNPIAYGSQVLERTLTDTRTAAGARTGVSTGTGAGAKTAAGVGMKTAAGTAAKGISTKVIAGLVAVAVAAGGGGAAYGIHKVIENREIAKMEAAIEEPKETVPPGEQASEKEIPKKETKKETETDKTEAPDVPKDGLAGFAVSQKLIGNQEYDGYMVGKTGYYDGGEYYYPYFEYDISDGWAGYQIADLDGDGEQELVALVACTTQEEWEDAPSDTVKLEVYEWENGEVKLADSRMFKDEFEKIALASCGSILNCFIYGENSNRIGLVSSQGVLPNDTAANLSAHLLEYKQGKLTFLASAAGGGANPGADIEYDHLADDSARRFNEQGVSVTWKEIRNAPKMADEIEQYVENYQCITKVVSELNEGMTEIDSWVQRAYQEKNLEAKTVSRIHIESGAVNDTESGEAFADKDTSGEDDGMNRLIHDGKTFSALWSYEDAVKGKDYYAYSFVFVDGDDIPELLAEGKATANGSDLYYYHETGTGVENNGAFVHLEFGQVCIAERSGYFDNHWTRDGQEGHTIYKLEDQNVENLGSDMAKFPYKEKECSRYVLGTCKYTSLAEACEAQLGMEFPARPDIR